MRAEIERMGVFQANRLQRELGVAVARYRAYERHALWPRINAVADCFINKFEFGLAFIVAHNEHMTQQGHRDDEPIDVLMNKYRTSMVKPEAVDWEEPDDDKCMRYEDGLRAAAETFQRQATFFPEGKTRTESYFLGGSWRHLTLEFRSKATESKAEVPHQRSSTVSTSPMEDDK